MREIYIRFGSYIALYNTHLFTINCSCATRLDYVIWRTCSHTTMSTQTSEVVPPVNRHKLTAVERQRAQLDKLLKDPTKTAYVPPPPKEKSIRPAREMMKNVQGSSAGAGSGEFHVYKASRRREYERLSLLEEASRKVRPHLSLKCAFLNEFLFTGN